MSSGFRYDLYGAGLVSDRPLESVPSSGLGGPAAPLRIGELPPRGAAEPGDPVDGALPRIDRLPAGAIRVRFADMACFVLEPAGGIWCDWPSPLTQRDAETYLLGPVAGLHARLRGRLAIHASVVEARGRAIAFAGDSGSGKSTLAAAFARAGHRVLSDDLLVLDTDGGSPSALPGYPGVRLWAESVAGLFGDAEALPRMTPGWDKRYLDLAGPGLFQNAGRELAAICVLTGERGPAAQFERLTPAAALVELSRHTQGSRVLAKNARRDEFRSLGELARAVPVWRLSAPRHDALTKFCEHTHVFHS